MPPHNEGAIFQIGGDKISEIIVGIDPSLTSTGLTIYDNISYKSFIVGSNYKIKKFINSNYKNIFFNFINRKKYKNDIEYILKKIDFILSIFNNYEKNIKIFIENYSFGSFARSKISSVIEFVGILKYELFKNNFSNVNLVAPTTIKKVISGKGNSSKDNMYKIFKTSNYYKKLPNEYVELLDNLKKIESPLSDLLDSIYITVYGIYGKSKIKEKYINRKNFKKNKIIVDNLNIK